MSLPFLRLRVGQRQFAPTLLPSLTTVLLLVILLNLGFWQLRRAEEKRALMAQAASGQQQTLLLTASNAAQMPRYQHVQVSGRFDTAHQVLLDSMASQAPATLGRTGYRVLTPLHLPDNTTLLIDRGWLAGGERREQLPQIEVDDQIRNVTGLLDELSRPGVRAGNAGVGEHWPQVLNYPRLEELRTLYGPALQPRIVLLDPQQPDGFERLWQINVGFGPERHIGYAVQWFAMSVALLIIYFVVNTKKIQRHD